MKKKLHLKHLIIIAVVMAFLFSLTSNLVNSYRWNVKMLEEKSLETNRIYAVKLAQLVDLYLNDTFQLLKYSANEFSDNLTNTEKLQSITETFLKKDATFSSVAVINTDGELLAGAPSNRLNFQDRKLNFANEGLKVIHQTKPYISKPHTSPTGQEVIILSQPLYSKEGKHVAVLAVTIYIHDETNAFHTILGTHYYNDGSYVYVVDQDGRIIYHKDPSRLDDIVTQNPVVQKVMKGQSGTDLITNSKGIQMLAGYSVSKIASWGIVSQTPVKSAIAPAGENVLQMFFAELPVLLIAFLIVLVFASKIAKPLKNIAQITEDSVDQSELKQLNHLKAWYYEAQQIKSALITSFSFLHEQVNYFMDQSTIDPLTGLTNRRTIDTMMKNWADNNVPFAVVLIDIDYFKAVNDLYGHAIGDEVLRFFADQLKIAAKSQDICSRFGGEEFTILLPNTTSEEAYVLMEQLRKKVGSLTSPTGSAVTFSAGVAAFPEHTLSISKLVELSDHAMYEAKRRGRNQVIVANDLKAT